MRTRPVPDSISCACQWRGTQLTYVVNVQDVVVVQLRNRIFSKFLDIVKDRTLKTFAVNMIKGVSWNIVGDLFHFFLGQSCKRGHWEVYSTVISVDEACQGIVKHELYRMESSRMSFFNQSLEDTKLPHFAVMVVIEPHFKGYSKSDEVLQEGIKASQKWTYLQLGVYCPCSMLQSAMRENTDGWFCCNLCSITNAQWTRHLRTCVYYSLGQKQVVFTGGIQLLLEVVVMALFSTGRPWFSHPGI